MKGDLYEKIEKINNSKVAAMICFAVIAAILLFVWSITPQGGF